MSESTSALTLGEAVSFRPVDSSDLTWFLERQSSLKWRFAHSMPTVPHSYVVRGSSWSDEEHLRAFGVLQTFGTPGKFHDRTSIYLFDEQSGRRFWPMTTHSWQTKIINMAEDDRMYGTQDAPSTQNEWFAPYDAIAWVWDDMLTSTTKEERTLHWKAAIGAVPKPHPRTLDLGAGTGGTLDAHIAGPRETTVVDPSQGMLNGLVMKYPAVRSVQPVTAEEFLSWETGTFDLVIASFGSASYLSPWAIENAAKQAKGAAILSFYRDGFVPTQYRLGDLLQYPDDQESKELAKELSSSWTEAGNYVIFTIEGRA